MLAIERMIHVDISGSYTKRRIQNLRARIKSFADMLKYDLPTCRVFVRHTSASKLRRLLLESKTDSLHHVSPLRKAEWARMIEQELRAREERTRLRRLAVAL